MTNGDAHVTEFFMQHQGTVSGDPRFLSAFNVYVSYRDVHGGSEPGSVLHEPAYVKLAKET